jgi:LysM repeat protein
MADAGDPAAPTRRRSWVARILAPLALAAAILAVVLIVSGSLGIDDEPAGRSGDDASKEARSEGGDSEKEDGSEDEEEDSDTPETYEVQSGDSLSSIAAEYGLSVEKLQRLNPDADPTALATGQVLKLQ